jgi:phenylpropionate dioxygenase-like ring-hydroxylating dioxygenase large terminal subunit
MLTLEENESLTRIGAGTPMGELYRRFWLPVLLAHELPAPDAPPVRVQILDERLVAFRDSSGRIGVLDARCPHRLANLFWGRNEEGGLRCAYHGWKYDVDGRCMDIPNAPEGASFKEKIEAFAAYPAREAGGLIWVYMGPKEAMPELPDLDLIRVPESHRYISKMFIGGNWLQGVEGDMDSSHVSFLHSRVDGVPSGLAALDRVQAAIFVDKTPTWDIRDTEYGIMLGAQRNGPDGTYYWRINQWLMPSFTMIAARPGNPVHFQVRVPSDDEHQIYFRVVWHPSRPLSDEELRNAREDGVNFPFVDPVTFLPMESMANDYLIDRESQRTSSFTGIKSIPAQDWAMQEEQGGPIFDRSLEHLVSADASIIAVRRRLLQTVRELQEGTEPSEPHSGSGYHVRPIDITLSADVSVWDGARDYYTANAW